MSFSSIVFKVLSLTLLGLSFSLHGKPYQKIFKPLKEAPRSSIKGIDGVYVINLDVRPEKWHRIEPLLYYHGVEHTRFPAVFGLGFDVSTIKQFCAKHLRVGALGCMLSHLSIYHDALQRNLKTIWVIEDDLIILRDPKHLTLLIEELNQIDPEWDVLYTDTDFVKRDGTPTKVLGFPIDKKHPFPFPIEYYTYRENVSENIQLLRSRYATTSMIVSERGMKKALEYFTGNDDIIWPIDIEFHYIPGIRQYGIIDPIATNGYFSFGYSDAGSRTIKNFYEIDDKNVEYLEERHALFNKILENWYDFMGTPKTPK